MEYAKYIKYSYDMQKYIKHSMWCTHYNIYGWNKSLFLDPVSLAVNLHDRPNFNDNRHPLSRETLKQNTVLNGFAESRVTIIRYFHFQNIFLKLVLNNINEEEVGRQSDQQGRLGIFFEKFAEARGRISGVSTPNKI